MAFCHSGDTVILANVLEREGRDISMGCTNPKLVEQLECLSGQIACHIVMELLRELLHLRREVVVGRLRITIRKFLFPWITDTPAVCAQLAMSLLMADFVPFSLLTI